MKRNGADTLVVGDFNAAGSSAIDVWREANYHPGADSSPSAYYDLELTFSWTSSWWAPAASFFWRQTFWSFSWADDDTTESARQHLTAQHL
jgi:hypothetical protein